VYDREGGGRLRSMSVDDPRKNAKSNPPSRGRYEAHSLAGSRLRFIDWMGQRPFLSRGRSHSAAANGESPFNWLRLQRQLSNGNNNNNKQPAI